MHILAVDVVQNKRQGTPCMYSMVSTLLPAEVTVDLRHMHPPSHSAQLTLEIQPTPVCIFGFVQKVELLQGWQTLTLHQSSM